MKCHALNVVCKKIGHQTILCKTISTDVVNFKNFWPQLYFTFCGEPTYLSSLYTNNWYHFGSYILEIFHWKE